MTRHLSARHRARIRVAAVVVAGLPLLVACGGSSSEVGTSPAAASAGSPASAAPSAPAPAAEAAIEPAALIATSAAKAKKVTSAKMTMTMVSASGTINIAAEVAYQPLRMSMLLSGMPEQLGSTMQQILVDNVMYLSAPTLAEATGKKWVKIDLAAAAGSQGLDLAALTQQSEQADPSQAVRLLEQSADLTEVGTEDVGGVPTRHLRGTLDLSKDLAALAPDLQEKFAKSLGGQDLGTMELDVWIGADGLPRKTVQAFAPGGMPMTITMLVDSYNEPVTVVAPSASEVSDLAAMGG